MDHINNKSQEMESWRETETDNSQTDKHTERRERELKERKEMELRMRKEIAEYRSTSRDVCTVVPWIKRSRARKSRISLFALSLSIVPFPVIYVI